MKYTKLIIASKLNIPSADTAICYGQKKTRSYTMPIVLGLQFICIISEHVEISHNDIQKHITHRLCGSHSTLFTPALDRFCRVSLWIEWEFLCSHGNPSDNLTNKSTYIVCALCYLMMTLSKSVLWK